jgi:hypothetical protein
MTVAMAPRMPAVFLALEKRQQVRIDLVRLRRGHPMREILVGFQGSVLQQLSMP